MLSSLLTIYASSHQLQFSDNEGSHLSFYSCSDVVLVMYNHLPLIIDDLIPPENSGDLVDLAGKHINLLFPNIVKVANSIPSGFN